jgi:hypothetical protein
VLKGPFGSFILFETGFTIHDGAALEQTIWRQASLSDKPYGRRNLLLYFEHVDVAAAFESIEYDSGNPKDDLPRRGKKRAVS